MRAPARQLLLALTLFAPASASAQIGVGAHVGTIGFGGDIALAIGGSAQVRGSVGITPIKPTWEIAGFDTKLELPSSFITIGVDFFPSGSGFRLGGGLLLKPDDPTLTADCTGTQTVGNQSYSCDQLGTATANVDMKGSAPFLMIGFGKHASGGIGLFLDLGAAFIGESELSLEVDGPIRTNATFQQELAREEQEWEDKINEYKIYPILSAGLRVGIGN
jgi:hypothetical protein